jgi:probable F420-dependent oxidoreductase
MKVGIRIPTAGPLADPDSIAAVAARAEDLGFDSLWTTEHFALPDEYAPAYAYTTSGKSWWTADSPHLEPLTALAWLAARTTRIRLGTSVIVLPFRNPIVTAKEVATVDHLSRGRLILGVGTGWLQTEFDAMGVPFKQRASRTREGLAAMRALWTQQRPLFEGRYYTFDGTWGSAPKPLQQPHPPIWVGGESRGALERVADLGDAWHPAALSADQLEAKLDELHDVCAERGRDPRSIEITLRVLPANEIDEHELDRLHRLNVTHIVLDPAYTHDSLDAYLADVDRLAAVMRRAHALGTDATAA